MLPAEDTTRTLDDFSDSASLEAEEDGARHDAVEDELSDNAQDELVWMGQFVEDLAVDHMTTKTFLVVDMESCCS